MESGGMETYILPTSLHSCRQWTLNCNNCGLQGHHYSMCLEIDDNSADTQDDEFACNKESNIESQKALSYSQQSNNPNQIKISNAILKQEDQPSHLLAKTQRIEHIQKSCYVCGKIGHIARQCDQAVTGSNICYFCGQVGHYLRQCSLRISNIESLKKLNDNVIASTLTSMNEEPMLNLPQPPDHRKSELQQSTVTNSHIKCYKCQGYGHFWRVCPQFPQIQITKQCFKCQSYEHLERDCPINSIAKQTIICNTCAQPGHMSRECQRQDLKRSNKRCFECGSSNHLLSECKERVKGPEIGCYECGQTGHFVRECPYRAEERNHPQKCYLCASLGHYAKDCTNSESGTSYGLECYRCGQVGHLARNCLNSNEVYASKTQCYRCRGQGHQARDCPASICYLCREIGHFAKDCDQITLQTMSGFDANDNVF